MAKKELFGYPAFGNAITRMNAMPIKRGAIDREAIGTALRVIGNGYGLTVFPEGTRSRTGRLGESKPGIGILARQAGCPIVPMHLHGSNELSRVFWGRSRLTMRFGEPISADWILSLPEEKDSYRLIAAETMKRIRELGVEGGWLKPPVDSTDS